MITLITGGSGSGKSEFAEDLTISYNSKNLIYIATMYPYDKEALKKIDRHKDMRKNKGFKTYEVFSNLKGFKPPKNSTILLDCISNLLANEMFMIEGAKNETVNEIVKGIKKLSLNCENLVIVTNEVFSDGIKYSDDTDRYIKYLGNINSEIGKIANQVIEVVYTIPIYHKGGNNNVEFF